MKKTLLMVALLAGLGTANAQNLAGRFFIGGDVLNFSNTSGKTVSSAGTTTNTTTTMFGIVPTIGYCLTDNWAIGARLGYNMTIDDDNGAPTEVKNKISTVTFSPFVRYNMAMTDKFSFFMDGGISYSMSTINRTISSTPPIAVQPNDNKANTFGVNVGPGFLWFVRDNIAIQGNIASFVSFASTVEKNNRANPTEETTTNNFNIGLNGGVGLGLYYYFGGNK